MMPEQYTQRDRANLLADVAEMYYLQGKSQAEIAHIVGLTRSMISRLLTEAREKGIVEIRVNRNIRLDHDLETALAERFGLLGVHVVDVPASTNNRVLNCLGEAAALLLKRYLAPGLTLGISWGTSVSATVDAIEYMEPLGVKVIQLVGAFGARITEYDGHALVSRLAEKLGGDSYYLNAPFLCPNAETAMALRQTQSVKEAINLGKQAQLALLGVGSVLPRYSSYYLAAYVAINELEKLQREGAVGDVCGIHFDIHGYEVGTDFSQRSVTINKDDLINIPYRIGVAGGVGKAAPVLGALLGGYINMLITDSFTARNVLGMAEK